MEKVSAIVLAAGQGKRMGTKVAKQFLKLNDKPIIYYSLKAFEEAGVEEIILVTGKDSVQYCQNEIVEKYHFSSVKAIVAGGKERYHSVYNGLNAVHNSEIVMIHDGARPFLTQKMIQDSYETAKKESKRGKGIFKNMGKNQCAVEQQAA